MGLMDRLRSLVFPKSLPYTEDFWPYMNFGGSTYPIGVNQTLQGEREDPPQGFAAVVNYMYKNNAVVFACIDNRVKLFSEARFQFRNLRGGRPAGLYGNSELALLETPWPGGTTGDLLAKMLQYADLEGDAFVVRLPGRLAVPRPDWVSIALSGVVTELGTQPIGYIYYPGGMHSGAEPVPLDVLQVAHFAPIPDPLMPHRGMSWMTPIIREVMADAAMTDHKRMFLVNGATPNLVISLDPALAKEAFDKWVTSFKAGHEGTANAYKTLFLGGGAKVEPVGKDLQQIDFKVVQGAGETRIAAAAGVPPVIAGLSEGLQAATYSNYAQAKRRFADNTIRPLWRNAAGSLAQIINVPAASELWYDDRDVEALREDVKDAAETQDINARAIKSLLDAGFKPDVAVKAITTGDLTQLVGSHTGLFSVQLQPPQPNGPPAPPVPPPVPEQTPPAPPARDALVALAEAGERRADAAERRAEAPLVVNLTTGPTTITTPPPTLTIEEGAVQVSAPVTIENRVEPTPVTVEVEPTPVTVENRLEPAQVTVENRVEPTLVEIHVEPTPVTIETTVEPTPIEVRNEVTVAPTPVEITNEVTVEPTPVAITQGDVHVAAPEVTVRAEMPATMTMQITSMPPQSMEITALPPVKKRVTKRDAQGRIIEVEEE